MRKNLAKHTAKKLPLAKRVLALCFALIFVCSCLLPAFANGTGGGLDTPDTEVVEAADPGTEPEPMDLYDEPAALDDDFAVADEPAAMDDDFAVADEPAAMDDQVEKPVVDDEPAAMDNEVEKPVEGDEPPVADDTSAKEGATKTTTDASGNTVYEYDTSGTTFPEDDAAALPDGDQVLDQMDAAFSIPTNIYHFWLKKMSSYDLADIATDAEAAEMTVEQYLAMYGTEKGCYHIMTAADGANLKDYQFADPTSNDDPEGNSRTFAGWYYTDDLGDEQKFVFDEFLYISESTTVEVYAKWKAEAKPVTTTAEINALETAVTVDGLAGVDALNVSRMDEDDEDDFVESFADKLDMEKNINLYAFDLTPVDKNGDTVQPDSGKKATVTIEGFDVTADDTVKVFHKADTGLEDLTSTASVDANGTLTFKTSSFSPFGVVVERAITNEDDEDASGGVETLQIRGANQVKIGETITLTSDNKGYRTTGDHNWTITQDNDTGKIRAELTVNSDTSVGITGVTVGTVTVKHTFNYQWRNYWRPASETYTVSVIQNPDHEQAAVFIRLTPNASLDDYGTGAWGDGILYAYVDVPQNYYVSPWEGDGRGNYGIKDNPEQYILTWPDGSTSTEIDGKEAWHMPLDTVGYPYGNNQSQTKILDQIWEQWQSQIETDIGRSLTKDEITDIYVIPYKISRNSINKGNLVDIPSAHIDCYFKPICKNIFMADFYITMPDGTQKKVSSKNYYKDPGVTIPELNGATLDKELYPDEIEENGVTYTFDGWDNEAKQRVEDWTNGYPPNSDELADGVVNFYAHYTPKTQKTIKVTKIVTGWFGDQTKAFTFTVTDKKGVIVGNFSLASGESKEIENFKVQVGDTVTITETNAENYETTAQIYNSSKTGLIAEADQKFVTDGTSKSIQIKITQDMIDLDEIEIFVTNHREGEIDNGVLLDTLPYILILVVVVGGGVLLFLRKRKNDDDE